MIGLVWMTGLEQFRMLHPFPVCYLFFLAAAAAAGAAAADVAVAVDLVLCFDEFFRYYCF